MKLRIMFTKPTNPEYFVILLKKKRQQIIRPIKYNKDHKHHHQIVQYILYKLYKYVIT